MSNLYNYQSKVYTGHLNESQQDRLPEKARGTFEHERRQEGRERLHSAGVAQRTAARRGVEDPPTFPREGEARNPPGVETEANAQPVLGGFRHTPLSPVLQSAIEDDDNDESILIQSFSRSTLQGEEDARLDASWGEPEAAGAYLVPGIASQENAAESVAMPPFVDEHTDVMPDVTRPIITAHVVRESQVIMNAAADISKEEQASPEDDEEMAPPEAARPAEEPSAGPNAAQPWWKKKHVLIGLAILLLLIVVAAIVAVIALGGGDDESPTDSPTPAPVLGVWNQLGNDISGEAPGDLAGYSVSLSADGMMVAVGAMQNDGGGTDSGHARVYRLQGQAWVQVGQDLDGEAAYNGAGRSVSLSADGSRVAIGAWGNDASGPSAGHVRIYSLTGQSWTQLGSDIDGQATGDQFGIAVALSSDGQYLAVGANQYTENGIKPGYARVYEMVGGDWVQLGLDIVGEAAGDGSGYSISLSNGGMTVAIGAHLNDDNGNDSGHVRVYRLQGTSWVQLGDDIDGGAPQNQFGGSVSLSADGMIIAIGGGPSMHGNGDIAGHARVYKLIGSSWTQIGQDVDGTTAGDWFGTSVSLSADGRFLAVGADQYVEGGGSFAGYARVFELIAGSWTQIGGDIMGKNPDDQFGWSISLSADGSTVAIGGINNDDLGENAGHVRLYKLETEPTAISGVWEQLGGDIDGEAAGDELGFSVSLSEDGRTIAVGARKNDGGGTDSGHVRVHQLQGESWVQVGQDLDGEAAYDGAGRSVSLSADGSSVAFGAWGNNANGLDAGHVRVYERTGMSWTQVGEDIDGKAAGDQFGVAVSLSGNGQYLAVGANQYTENDIKPGYSRVYQITGGSWVQLGQDVVGEADGDDFGYSISLSDDGMTVAIGADMHDDNGELSGHVRVYRLQGANWVQLGDDIDGESQYDRFGWSVSLSADGTSVAIGGPLNYGNGPAAGHARVFRISGSSWIQVGEDMDGTEAGDQFGSSVSLSAGGDFLAVGGDQYTEGGSRTGYARVFQLVEESWVQVGQDITGEAAGDWFGFAISLSADGRTVAVGGPMNNGTGEDAGHARVYGLVEQ